MKEDEEEILQSALHKVIYKPRLYVQSRSGYIYLQKMLTGAVS